MNLGIRRKVLPTLWYQNEQQESWVQKDEPHPWLKRVLQWVGAYEPPEIFPPAGFIYQHSRFPNVVRHTVLRAVLQKEVAACDHEPRYVQETFGWIDGIEGRECVKCNGTQLRKKGDPWPVKWDAEGSRRIISGESSYPGDLVMAMLRPTILERARQIYRYGLPAMPFKKYGQAVLYASVACERCMNALAYRHGLNWGYAAKGDEWKECNTSCELCE